MVAWQRIIRFVGYRFHVVVAAVGADFVDKTHSSKTFHCHRNDKFLARRQDFVTTWWRRTVAWSRRSWSVFVDQQVVVFAVVAAVVVEHYYFYAPLVVDRLVEYVPAIEAILEQ